MVETQEAAEVPTAIRQRILSFSRPADWDGLGGLPITLSACKRAVGFLEAAYRRIEGLPAPRVSPSALGAISLYWRLADRYFTVRVLSEGDDLLEYQEKYSHEPARPCFAPAAALLKELRRFLRAA